MPLRAAERSSFPNISWRFSRISIPAAPPKPRRFPMPRLPLTDEQRDAVRASSSRLFIEAAPGAGKTTVAAERYGVLRFTNPGRSRRAITAVSFTRSATGELHRRIRSRWGSSALAWPHGVMTIDAMVLNIVESMLRQGVIHWLGDHTSLKVRDDWRGHHGYRWLRAE